MKMWLVFSKDAIGTPHIVFASKRRRVALTYAADLPGDRALVDVMLEAVNKIDVCALKWATKKEAKADAQEG